MAPSGARMMGISPRASPLETITDGLSSEQVILMTHLVVWLLAIISGVFLALRFFAIWYRKSVLLIDDGLLTASWIIVLFYSITASVSLALGIGTVSSSSSSPSSPSAPLLLDNVTRTMALTAAAWAKSAFAFGILPLSDRRGMRWALLGLIAFVNAVAVGGIVTQWVRCRPIFKAWVTGVDGTCFARSTINAVGITVQASYAFADLVLVVLGYMLVWSKGLGLGEKAGIGLLGLLGLLASTAAILTAIELSSLTDANFTESDIRPLLFSAIETPLIIIASSLPALRLLRSTTTVPLRIRIRHSIHHNRHQRRRRPSSSSLTPLDPSSPYTNTANGRLLHGGLPPPVRPLRPESSRSFMTTSTKVTDNNNNNYYIKSPGHPQQQQQQQQRGLMTTPLGGKDSSETLAAGIKGGGGLDYNFSYWNPAIPPTTPMPTTPLPQTPRQEGHQQQQQQQQQQGHEPALSTSSTLHAVPSTPEKMNHSSSTRGGATTGLPPSPNPSYSLGASSNSNSHSNIITSNNNNNTLYNWHSTENNNNRRLTPLQEEQSRTTSHEVGGVPSWTSEFNSDIGVLGGRHYNNHNNNDASTTLHRNASTRRESPTLGHSGAAAWNNDDDDDNDDDDIINRPHNVHAARNTRERDLLEREREFEYDLPVRAAAAAGGKSYFSRLQALSGYTVGNPFTSRI